MLTNDQLIELFLNGESGDAASAFETLVKRYGPMVLGVCRQILNHQQDAEDAFQATFLSLARKAGTIRDRRVLGCWLYQVAYRIAKRARARTARKRMRQEARDVEAPAGEPEDTIAWNEFRPVLHAEVHRLPAKYRTPMVHCHLEGKTIEEAARLLQIPIGTVKGRLSRARDLLRARLIRRDRAPDQRVGLWG